MNETLRATGLEVMSHLAWGSHFCNFYDTKQDLLDILVPYFRSGMENNEFCFWVTEDSISVEDARLAIQLSARNQDHDPSSKNIEIVSYRDWYLPDGNFDLNRCLKGWHDLLQQALSLGYEGLRVNGDENWLNEEMWQQFIDYEMELNACVKGQRMIILCAYSLHKCSASAVLDVALVHEFAASKRRGYWAILETPALKQAKSELMEMNENLEQCVAERTEQLALTCRELADEVDERKRVEQELRKSEASIRVIFDQTDIALMLLNSSLETLVENAAAKTWAAIASAADRQEEMMEMMSYGLRGISINEEIAYLSHDDVTVWYQVKVDPVTSHDGEVMGLCIAAADITASKTEEIELSKLTSDLIQRNKDLEHFASIVSHNLRAPVANIIGLSRLLHEKPKSDAVRSQLELALFTSAQNLDVVIHDLNSILQAKREVVEKKEMVNLHSVIETTLSSLQKPIQETKTQFRIDISEADEMMSMKSYVYSIFFNLVSNSIKFCRSNETPMIEINSERFSGKTRIRIKDNGIGIDLEKYKEQLYAPYKRFHPYIPGKGLGLFMVKTQMEKLGGTIDLISALNQGTEVILDFPE